MLDIQVIIYYATKNGYIFEPGIRVPNDKAVEYIDGIRRGGDEVLLVSLEQDFELIRQAFFGPCYWEGRTWMDEFNEEPPKYPAPTFPKDPYTRFIEMDENL